MSNPNAAAEAARLALQGDFQSLSVTDSLRIQEKRGRSLSAAKSQSGAKGATKASTTAAESRKSTREMDFAAKSSKGTTLPYERILQHGNVYGFWYDSNESKRYHKPSKEEVVAHLKLLKAFVTLKKSITANVPNIERKDKLWQLYLTMAVRRFTIFMNAVTNYNNSTSPDASRFRTTFVTMLPPLDIILVWHSFTLNTVSFTDHIKRYQLNNFLNFGFPLPLISDLISNRSFKYEPAEHLWLNFNEFLHNYGKVSSSFKYNCYEVFVPSAINLDVYCPHCNELLINVPLMNEEFCNGFGDFNFEYKLLGTNCECGFNNVISHDELRKRQLWHDVTNSWFPFTSIPLYTRKNLAKEDSKVEQVIQLIMQDKESLVRLQLLKFVEKWRDKIPNKSFIQLRNYLTNNPIHATVENSKFIVNDDLVACVVRQERFIDKMEDLKWLSSSELDFTVLEAISRYEKFLDMFQYVNFPLVPTLDIDLVWHTHQLSQIPYYEYTRFKVGKVLKHDDKIEENRLNKGFEHTCAKFKSVFKQDYSICFCSYCSYQRRTNRNLFQKKKPVSQSPIKSTELNCNHISCHDSIHVPTSRVRKIETRLKSFYLRTYNNYLPWKERDLKGFATSPLCPINEDDKCLVSLYENGMCVGVNDPQSGCTAQSGNGCFAQPEPYEDPNRPRNYSSCGGSSG